MVRRIAGLLLFVALCGCASLDPHEDIAQEALDVPPNATVLRVRVFAVEFTDFSPCCSSADEIPFDFWYRYRAEVKEVLKGQWGSDQVSFVRLQHAEFIDAVTRDCYVVLTPASAHLKSVLRVDYVARQLLSKRLRSHQDAIRSLERGM